MDEQKVTLHVPIEFGDVEDGVSHDERLSAAQRVSQWEIGSPSWADSLIEAYLNPSAANAEMDGVGADPAQ